MKGEKECKKAGKNTLYLHQQVITLDVTSIVVTSHIKRLTLAALMTIINL